MVVGIPAGRQTAFFALLTVCYLYWFQIYPQFVPTNELSRLLLTSAVVQDGTFKVDRAISRYGDSEDKAFFAGHAYSDKAIGISLLSIPPFFVLRLIEDFFRVQFSASIAIFFLRIVVVTGPALLFLPVLARFWERLRVEDRSIPYFLLLFLFGTIAFPYSLQLISHSLLGILLFVPVYLLSGFHQNRNEIPSRNLWLSGAAIGLALTMEYPAVLPAAMVCVYVCWIVRDWKRLLTFAIPIAAFLVLMLSYNAAIFGTPFDVTYRHMTERHIEHHAHGLVGVSMPKPEAVWGLLFSRHHGLFFISPFLLFAIPGLFLMIRSKEWKAEGWLFAAISFSVLFVYSGFYYWIGGWAVGPRYLAPLMPFLVTAVFFFFTDARIRSNPALGIAIIATGVISILFVIAGTITFPYPPDVFSDPTFFVFFPLMLNGGQSISIGSLLGLSHFGAVLLFFTLLLTTFLIAVVPSGSLQVSTSLRRDCIASAALVAVFLVVCSWISPAPDSRQYYGRGLIYAFCGKYERAAIDMDAALSMNADKELEQRIRHAAFQIRGILQRQQATDPH
jgi:hypothetical protein